MDPKPSQNPKVDSQTRNNKSRIGIYPVPAAGALRIAGPDQVEFLQRQTTNDLGLLTESRPLATVLTSPTARILDVLTLIKTTNPESNEPELLALTLPGRAQSTAAHLKSKIFFMDDVSVADVSEAYRQIELLGVDSRSALTDLGFQVPAVPPSVKRLRFQGRSLILLLQDQRPPLLVVETFQQEEILARLHTAESYKLSSEAYEIARIEAGRPGPQNELTADYTPLENCLDWAISSTKGCYTGQEVIARQITYDKVTRKLVGVQLAAEVTVGAKVWAGMQAAGTVTSAALSRNYGPIALAMIKRPHYETGVQVNIGEQDAGIQGTIVDLPFSEAI